MRWKMTSRFLMTVLSIVLIVIFVNIVLLFSFFIFKDRDPSTFSTGDTVVTQLKKHISVENDEVVITDAGMRLLEDNNAWIQVLNQDGTVIQSFLTNNLTLKDHYSPVELVNAYKYRDIDKDTTTYIIEVEPFSIFIGIKDPNISRNVLTINNNLLIALFTEYLLYIILIDMVIAILAGLLFGSVLTKPLYRMIEQIQKLKNGEYERIGMKKPGIYKNVFTNLVEVSKDLKVQEEERKKLEKMRSDWITNISHDMKTPLASIRGYSELLLDDNVTDEERKNYAEVIERQSHYMQELLDDFNLTMRLRNAEMPLQLTTLKFEPFVRDVVIDFLNDAQFSNYDVTFESADDIPTLEIDQHLMKRAIINFLTNACVHNEPSTEVSVSLRKKQSHLLLTIQDNGKGIAPEDLPNIFERYYRGTNTTNIQGSGLGMAISRDIIEAHGGKIDMESTVGSGTYITITLPIN